MALIIGQKKPPKLEDNGKGKGVKSGFNVPKTESLLIYAWEKPR